MEPHAGQFYTNFSHNNQSVGMRYACFIDYKYTWIDSLKDFLAFTMKALIFIYIVLPITVSYFIYFIGYVMLRMGVKRTIKLFRRMDRESKRKKMI